MKNIFIVKIIFLSFLIAFFNPIQDLTAETVVQVLEGEVSCIDYPEWLLKEIEKGELRSGILIRLESEDIALVDIYTEDANAYIPDEVKKSIGDKLIPDALVLLRKNIRRLQGTNWDIIAVEKRVKAGYMFRESMIEEVSLEDVINTLSIWEGMQKVYEKVQEEIVMEEKIEEKGLAATRTYAEENFGEGKGPVAEAKTQAEVEDTQTPPSTAPTAPTPAPAPAEEATPTGTEFYWVNPTSSEYTYGSITVAANGKDSASNNGSNTQPWRTITYALTRVTSSQINLVATTYSTSTGETFPLTMNTNVDIVGRGAGSTTIQGDSTNRVITASSVTGVDIQNLTISNGTSSSGGGGVNVSSSTVAISSCTITSNSATGASDGGGIAADGTSTLTVSDSTISSNTTQRNGGGVALASGVSATFTSTTFSSNQGDGGSMEGGAGLYKTGAGNLTITACTFSSNSNVHLGGAIRLFEFTGTIDISRTRFTSNTTITGESFGSAMEIQGQLSGTLNITNCIFANNGNTSHNVFAVINLNGSSPTIMNCTFVSNRSWNFVHCGVRTDRTVAGYSFSTPAITNCIFYDNTDFGIYEVSVGNSPSSVTYCDLFGNTRFDYYDIDYANDGDPATNPNILGNVVDALAEVSNCNALYVNPSFDSNYKHAAGTVLVDGGTSTGAPSTDIAGTSRPQGAGIDVGAYERTASDPPITGKVYDSVTGEAITSPVVAIYSAGTTTAISTTTSNPYTFNVDPGNYYIAVSVDGYGFPSQILEEVVDGDHGDIFTASSTPLTIDIPMDPDGWLYIEKTVNKKKVSVGEIVTYNIEIQNKHWFKSVSNVELVDEIVNGFKYVDNSSISYKPSTINHKLIFDIGTVSANTTTNLSYQVRVGMGIPPGRYKAAANTRKSTTQERNSNISSVGIEVVEDPLFTRGTIIGKVYWEETKKGIPGVKIYTEYGVCVETDKDGKYHIADVPAGNHLLKVDPSSLPLAISHQPLATFTTDNPYFVKITEGLLAKVNFGINLDKEAINHKPSTINQFFIVALGEGVVRDIETSGNIEMVEKDDRFDDGLQVDGRIALYLKGKIKGKYLITASLDTERRPYGRYDTRDLFKNLDPDKYYPVYGDASIVDYSAVNTQEPVYIMIEWGESFARWGSFHTELPLYNRTLSGGIINYKSIGKTKFGDKKTEVKGFGAFSHQKPAHDEFVGTGGSLYYLRHDNIIMGSEKLRVEVRDRIGKTTISSIPLLEGKDYEIDYDTGRLLLKRSLNSIQQAYRGSIISNDILMGERVYLIVDYEYYSENLSKQSYGARLSQWVGDHIRLGGTYIEEEKEGDDYQIYGADGTIKINKDTVLNANYSHSEETQLGSTLSYDGGLTFQEQADTFSAGLDGDSYSIDGRTKLFGNTDISLIYTKQDPYYSATDSISKQGSEKYIADIMTKLTQNLSIGIRHITQRYKEEVTVTKTFGDRQVNTTTALLDYAKNKWDIRTEYQHQEVEEPLTTYTYYGTTQLLDNDFIAARIGYQLFKWFHPYIRGQVTVKGDANDQGTVGADISLFKNTSLNLAETVGTNGNSTLVGLTSKVTEDTDVYANLEVGNHTQLGRFTKTTYGQSSQLGKDSRAYIEQDYSSYRENIVRGNLLGYDKKITDTLAIGLTYERSNLENDTVAIDRDAGSIKLAYLNPDWLKLDSKVEVRNDVGGSTSLTTRQWVTENDILWRITDAISLTGRGNYGWTTDLDPSTSLRTDEAEFYELGTGFSLRPVTWDRLNLIGKYSYISNLPPESQLDFIEAMESRKHVYAIEGVYDLFRYLQLVGKFAYRDLEEKVGSRDWTQSDTYLYIARTNFHIMQNRPNKPFILKGWDLGVEYRLLTNDQIEDEREGFLVELDKDIGNYLRMGVGYNFTDYDDDLRDEDDWDASGWFVRINGKY